jgi:hypothetical protein
MKEVWTNQENSLVVAHRVNGVHHLEQAGIEFDYAPGSHEEDLQYANLQEFERHYVSRIPHW